MKNEKLIKSPAADAALTAASSVEPRALYHVYQKLNRLRDLIAAGDYPNAGGLAKKMEISLRTVKRYLDNLRECGRRSKMTADAAAIILPTPTGSCRRCDSPKATCSLFFSPNNRSNRRDKPPKPRSFANH